MALDKSKLLEAAQLIRNATRTGENTPERVGKLFVDIIDTFFSTSGSDQYLSRTRSDRSLGTVASDKGFEVGHYEAGVSGAVLQQTADGKTYAEVDDLYVRRNAVFESLLVKEAKAVGGCLYVTPGDGIKCTSVEETGTSYKCYFVAENSEGEKSETLMIADDLALCRRGLRAKAGDNGRVETKYYWRKVVGVSNDAYTDPVSGCTYGYVELSKSDCDSGSGIPGEGDEIVQLGYKPSGLKVDSSAAYRQSAIIISTVGANAPSQVFYEGINSYTLEGRSSYTVERDPATGKMHVRVGKTGESQYLDYKNGNLNIAGKLHVVSTNNDGDTSVIGLADTVVETDVIFAQAMEGDDWPPLPVYSSSDGTISDWGEWDTDAPKYKKGYVIWQSTFQRKADNSAIFTSPVCISGADGGDGRGISLVEEQYYLSRSRTQLVGGSWQNTPPDFVSGRFYWTRLAITYTDGTFEYTDPICVQGEQGASGSDAYRIDLSNEMAMVACDAAGNVTGSYPRCTVTVWKGATKVTPAGISFVCENISTGWVDKANGVFLTTGLTADTATVKVYATLADGNQLMAEMSIAKARPGQTGAKGADGKNGEDGADAVIYELIPTVNSVTRNSEGELSASSIGCTVYRVEGELRRLSNDLTVQYKRVPSGTSWVRLYNQSGITGSFGNVTVEKGDSAIMLRAIDSNGTVCDQETVPVLTDASGFVGGENLLKNTNQGVKGWRSSVYAAGNPTTPLMLSGMGEYPFGLVVNNSNAYPYGYDAEDDNTKVVSDVLYQLYFDLDSEFTLARGKKYILGFDMEINGRGLAYLTIEILGSGGSYTITTNDGGSWLWNASLSGATTVRCEIPIDLSSATADLKDRKAMLLTIGNRDVSTKVSDNPLHYSGELYGIKISNMKLERGCLATPWTASPRETNYLTEALEQDTTINGGLVLTSLIKLGYMDTSGNWKVGAGINGMLNPTADDTVKKGLIMLWSGGDQIDAAQVQVSSDDTATFLVRRDGSAYFCKNLIRFLEGRMEMGDSLFVDKDGLFLRNSSGDIYFKLTNQSVGDETSMMERSVQPVNCEPVITSVAILDTGKTLSAGSTQLTLGSGYYMVRSGTAAIATHSLNSGAKVSSHGADLSLTVAASFEYSSGNDAIRSQVSVRLVVERSLNNSAWTEVASAVKTFTQTGSSHAISHRFELSLEGGYYYRFRLMPHNALAPRSYASTGSVSMSLTLAGQLVSGNGSTTVMGNDGFATAWPNSTLLMAKDGYVTAQSGGVGFRVTGGRLQLMNNNAYYNFDFAKAMELELINKA